MRGFPTSITRKNSEFSTKVSEQANAEQSEPLPTLCTRIGQSVYRVFFTCLNGYDTFCFDKSILMTAYKKSKELYENDR